MKTFEIIYLPHHREDKEWIHFEAKDAKDLKARFKGGTIINFYEVEPEDE